MSDKTTLYHSVGRFDYVEPMNLNLTDTDTSIVNKPEDYSISVNLEVEIPSRFYSENNEVKLMASSDNGTLSFFGGSDVGSKTDKETDEKRRGYLTTSWTDIAVTNVDKGNKECLGIESINIAYSPNFFPIVTIRFVDVRGASLFMPQEKAYQIMAKENGYDPKVPFDGASVFKALFSMPCPIFKLTVKGFYGRPVTYKLMMSKFSSEFDSDNGNFIANVEFAGYMYGIYTELPMSFIALAPYIDKLDFWEKRNFTFQNGIQIPTIPDLIQRIASAQKNAPQEVLQSSEGKKFIETGKKLTALKKVRDEFPFREQLGWKKNEGEMAGRTKCGFNFADSNMDNFKNGKIKFNTDVSEDEFYGLSHSESFPENREVFYKVLDINNNFSTNSINCYDDSNISLFQMVTDDIVRSYSGLLESLIDEYGGEFNKYKNDFESILHENGFDKDIYINNELTHSCLPVYCLLVENDKRQKVVLGVDFFTQTTDKKTNKTYIVTYKGFRKDEHTLCTSEYIKQITDKLGIGETNNRVRIIYRVSSNILKYVNKEIEKLEKEYKEQKEKIYQQQSIEETKLLQFPLTIENVYDIIFAHIETFMTMFYRHLTNINRNADSRKEIINNVFANLADVPDLPKKENNLREIPPFPTFIDKTEKEGDKITWPCTLLNNRHIEETKFVEEILDAALQLGNKIEEAKRKNDEIAKSADASNYPVGTDSMIPSNIVDLLETDGNYNPYNAIYEAYKENPQDDIENKIRFTFAMRCAYFGMIFKKYRRYKYFENTSGGYMNVTINKENDFREQKIEMAETYFALSEACNIKKVFGDNISRSILINIFKDGATDDFKLFLGNYIQGKQSIDISNENSLNTSQNSKWNVTFNEEFKIDNDYVALPVRNIDKSKLQNDIKKSENCLTSDDYIVFKNNGAVTVEQYKDKILNKDSIRIKENSNFFTTLKNSIESDEVVKKCGWEKLGTFLEDFLVNYLGRDINTAKGDNRYDDSKRDNNNQIKTISPYLISGKTDIFTISDEKKTFNDLKKENKLYSDDISLQGVIGDKQIKYTSIINGLRCVDPVNVISTGSTSGNSTTHFPFEIYVSPIRFLNDDADIYDKAYLFLFSLPIVSWFSDAVTYANMQTVPKVCLLREGAFYYWQENLDKIKSHFFESCGSGMTENNIPVVERDETKTNIAPTLFLTNEGKALNYLTWDSKAKIPLNRRNKLIDLFMKWAESDEFNAIATIKGSLISGSFNSLTNSENEHIRKLYTTEVIYIDKAAVVERDMGVGYNEPGIGKCKEFCIDFFTKSYDKFSKFLDILYPKDNILTSPLAIDLTDSEKGVKSNKDLKLSIYLTLQTLYNKFVAGNKLERWKFDGNKDSDFNNFLFMDSYFNLIGQKLVFNGTRIGNMLSTVSDTVSALANSDENSYKGSVYQFFARLCQDNGCNLIALPIRPYTIERESNTQKLVWDLFDAIPYHKIKADDSSCFVSMYTYKPSEHLDIQNDNALYGYKQDGFNIVPNREEELPRQFKSQEMVNRRQDINANGESDSPISLQDIKIRIPSFGVTYAKQNQSIFKKINVSTVNPQITEPAIAMTFNIASKSDSVPRDSIIVGQDLYSVYSNYSYTCDVEMMGCAPIMPLMYFQLNNIPMFKGAYQIIHVEHNIVAGNMVTRFKGVRVNKNAIPFVRSSYVYSDDLGNRIYENGLYTEGSNVVNYNYNDGINYDYDSDDSMKGRMANAFDMTFNCASEIEGWCARYTYKMAYAFVKGENPCEKFPDGHANGKKFHDKLQKELGYTLSDEITISTPKECEKYINSKKFHYGDIVVYWAQTGNPNGKPKKYGHAQIYVGDAKPGVNTSKWASSMKDNHGSGMVYRNTGVGYTDWIIRIFRQTLEREKAKNNEDKTDNHISGTR